METRRRLTGEVCRLVCPRVGRRFVGTDHVRLEFGRGGIRVRHLVYTGVWHGRSVAGVGDVPHNSLLYLEGHHRVNTLVVIIS